MSQMGHTQPLANQSVEGRFWPFREVGNDRFSVARRAATGGSNTTVEWKALQSHRTLFVRPNPDQDKQSAELRNAGGFAERNAGAEIAETRM